MNNLITPGRGGNSRNASQWYPPLLPSPSRALLDEAVRIGLIEPLQIRDFFQKKVGQYSDLRTPEKLGESLILAGLLTEFQCSRLLAGQSHGLVLGNYRVLDKLGGGTVGIVFRGEHMMLRREVAIKVLPVDDAYPSDILERFHAEMRVLAQLNHPNIVMAYDAGVVLGDGRGNMDLHYLVMELVSGGDLENYLYKIGEPLPIPEACEIIRQAAAGLQVAHDNHLIHRDLKPSNLLLTGTGQVKVVDFGLARQYQSSMTAPKSLLGSLEFMSPEQSLDPTRVTSAADIYGLGATLFWILSGQTPYEPTEDLVAMLNAIQTRPPRRMSDFRDNIPRELDDFVDSMLARDPERRPAMMVTVMNFLSRYASPGLAVETIDTSSRPPLESPPIIETVPEAGLYRSTSPDMTEIPTWSALILDTDKQFRTALRKGIESLGCDCTEAVDPHHVFQALQSPSPPDLLILQHAPPTLDALTLSEKIRRRQAVPSIKVIVMANTSTSTGVAEALKRGADDLLSRTSDGVEFLARVQHLLRLKDAQDRTSKMVRHLMATNQQLEESLKARAGDVRKAHDAVLFTMAKMAETRIGETAGHLERVTRYSLALADYLKSDTHWGLVVDRAFLDALERCAPLHDIGKLGIPEDILRKPGVLTAQERRIIEQHPLLGVDLLDGVASAYGDSLSFLAMARAIIRSHHERFDGTGYPDRLVGEQIPEAARLVAVADVYDAYRRQLPHKAAMDHVTAARMIAYQSQGQFDPVVIRAFTAIHDKFEQIYLSIPN